MALTYVVANIDQALSLREQPAITRWNRLEGRPRTHNFDRAFKAEVRDALWMLTKQWQMGEFLGDDAASPAMARVCIDTAKIDRFQARQGPVRPLDLTQPLETTVERRALPLKAGTQYLSLDLRLAVGRRWQKLLARDRAAGTLSRDYRQAYLRAYPVALPDPARPADAAVCAHVDAWQQAAAAAGRAMDGIAFLDYAADPAHNAFDNVGAAPGDEARLVALAASLRTWFAALIAQPPGPDGDAWLPGRLEYQFGCAAPAAAGETVMRAEEYYQGHLDWYALEHRTNEVRLGNPAAAVRLPRRAVHTFIPAPIAFEGMPNTRWWSFEDRRTNFGEMKPDTTDLGKLLLMEFGLVYANDWFVLPYALDIGTVTEVKGIAITNVFGERLWIEPVRGIAGPDLAQWSMFALSGTAAARSSPPKPLVLLPAAAKVQQGAPVEEVAFIRDEMANMVWAVERRVPLPSGASRPGAEAGRELRTFIQKPLKEELERLLARKAEIEAIPEADRTIAEAGELAAATARLAAILPPDPKAAIRYQLMNTVPEHWIPFIPVHVPGSTREIQLQRAALPRILQGAPIAAVPQKVRPRTSLLQQNMPAAYFVHEEEVPRAGALVTQTYQRTRWIGGAVLTWFGVRKQTGRGEGSSGLAFDQLGPARRER